MCASCGCGKPNDTHGDQRHITLDQVQQAAAASNISPMDVAKNLMDSVQQSGSGGNQAGQSASASD